MNNRKRRRISFSRDVLLDSVDGKKTILKSNNISTSGIGLYADIPRVRGELVRLTFELVQNGEKREINVAGEIMHMQLAEHGYIFGVKFL